MDDPSLFGQVLSKLLEYGLAGVIIAYFAWDNYKLRSKVNELYEKRIEEAVKTVTQSTSQTVANDKLADALRALASGRRRDDTP